MNGILLGIFIVYGMTGFYFALGYVHNSERIPLTWGWLILCIVFWPWVLMAKCAILLGETKGCILVENALIAFWALLDQPIRKERRS